jgi:hypothetical protein
MALRKTLVLIALFVAVASAVVIPLHGRSTRKLTRMANGVTIPMPGNLTYWGEYFMEVKIGTPPQSVYLQVDTFVSLSVGAHRSSFLFNDKLQSYNNNALCVVHI